MNRTQRRKAAKVTACSICFGVMTHQDRQPYRLGPAHPRCVTKQALAEAAEANAKLDQLKSNAEATMTALATQRRAQAMGLWTPGQ